MIVNLCTPSFDPCDSYGRMASELYKGMVRDGVHVNTFGGEPPNNHVKPVTGGLLLGYPTDFHKFPLLTNMGPRVAVTTFESTIVPAGWQAVLNACKAVIVPSTWSAQNLRENGVTVPVYVVPHGIDDTFKQAQRRRKPRFGKFTFIAYADRGRRKGWQHALAAFVKAFKGNRRYRLIIKSRREGLPAGCRNKGVEVLRGDLSDAQLVDLYHRCHVMLAPAAGEGFGFLPREFAATGGVALATNWSGLTDGIDQWGVPIPYEMETAWQGKEGWDGLMGEWARVDVDALALLMRNVAAHYDDYASFAVRAAGYVAANYRWETYVQRVWGIWQQVFNESVEDRHASNGNGKNTVTATAL